MRHVDEGTIHAWLDGQITDPGETAWIEEHLRWCAACGARLAEERATLEQAHALLSIAAPAAEPPAFDSLVAKASQANDAAPAVRRMQGHRWLIQAGWAASLALAVGIGWMAREITDRERPSVEPPATERAAASSEPPAPSVQTLDSARERIIEDAANSAGAVLGSSSSAARAEQRASSRRASPTPAVTTQASKALGDAAPPPVVAQAESATQEPPPNVNAPAASARQAFLPPAAAPAPVSPPPLAEQVTVTGTVQGSARPAPAGDWRDLPRTEAAARSGMPLYGIDGLLPTSTTISADDRVVRTVYRLDSGDSVVLEQRRASPDAAGALSPVQSARSALTARGRGIAAGAAAASPQEWSIVRGDVRVTLQTVSPAADLNALGGRLRVD